MKEQNNFTGTEKIVLTGGPSSGKSSTLEAFLKLNLGVPIVQETAALLLRGGYPAPEVGNLDQSRLFQQIILHLQHSLESMTILKFPRASHMILDRATLDGVGYWPAGPNAYIQEFKIDVEAELRRYDHVIYFAMPPKDHFGGKGRERFHDFEQSCEIAKKQFEIWSKHRHFIEVPSHEDLKTKVEAALQAIRKIVGK